MTDEVHDALEKWHKRTAHGESDRLVFAHPEAGTPLDRTKVTRYFQSACVAAGVRVIRFHDLRCPNPRGPGMLRLLTVAGARQPT